MTPGEVDHLHVLAAAAGAVGVSELTRVEELAGSQRTTVWRVTDGHQSYVLKIYLNNKRNTWAREARALEAAGPVMVAPRLVGVCADPQLIVMSDLGTSTSLADVVLGEDPLLAAATVAAWARNLARLQSTGAEVAASYGNRLWSVPAFVDMD